MYKEQFENCQKPSFELFLLKKKSTQIWNDKKKWNLLLQGFLWKANLLLSQNGPFWRVDKVYDCTTTLFALWFVAADVKSHPAQNLNKYNEILEKHVF